MSQTNTVYERKRVALKLIKRNKPEIFQGIKIDDTCAKQFNL